MVRICKRTYEICGISAKLTRSSRGGRLVSNLQFRKETFTSLVMFLICNVIIFCGYVIMGVNMHFHT